MRIDRKIVVRVALCTAALVIPFAGLGLLLYAFFRRARQSTRRATPAVASLHPIGRKPAVALELNGLVASPTK
jgi:hypothetical protein